MEAPEVLAAKLETYSQQLAVVEAALLANPTEEMIKVQAELTEVITLTSDLLNLSKAAYGATDDTTTEDQLLLTQPSYAAAPVVNSKKRKDKGPPSPPTKVSIFKPHVGSKVEAQFTSDGLWYPATVDEVNEAAGTYKVVYSGYGNTETLPLTALRDPEEDRKLAIPKNLRILPTDTESVRTSKKKRIHAIKSKIRMKNLEEEGKSKQLAWKSFTTKATKKAPGFVQSTKKGSIFQSPDSVEGKVGVTGSGKGMTANYDLRELFTSKKVKKSKSTK